MLLTHHASIHPLQKTKSELKVREEEGLVKIGTEQLVLRGILEG